MDIQLVPKDGELLTDAIDWSFADGVWILAACFVALLIKWLVSLQFSHRT